MINEGLHLPCTILVKISTYKIKPKKNKKNVFFPFPVYMIYTSFLSMKFFFYFLLATYPQERSNMHAFSASANVDGDLYKIFWQADKKLMKGKVRFYYNGIHLYVHQSSHNCRVENKTLRSIACGCVLFLLNEVE